MHSSKHVLLFKKQNFLWSRKEISKYLHTVKISKKPCSYRRKQCEFYFFLKSVFLGYFPAYPKISIII